MTEEEDDEDIYADLTTLNIVNAEPKVDEEKVKLQSLLEEKEQELNNIRENRNALEKEKKTLEENISSLFKTAVNELKKKDAVIAELTRQKDAIVFRRGKRHNLDTNRDVFNSSHTLYSKQPLIENDAAMNESTQAIEPSCNQKTSKCESSSANVTAVKLINMEDTYSDSSYVKSSMKYSGSKGDVPEKGGTEGNSVRRSGSSDSNSKERYTSYNKTSSRSTYNQHSSSRWRNGEKRGEDERSKDLSRHRNSSQEDRMHKRYDAEDRYHPRSHVRSPSPKRNRRESSRERYYDWKRRSSRSSYHRPPPSDSVRVAAQVKSKYSKVDRERSLSRTPVKKQKCTDIVDSNLEVMHEFVVLSELDSTEDVKACRNNLLTLPKDFLDSKDYVDCDVKQTSGTASENEDDDEEFFPLCKSPRVMSDGNNVPIPSNKLTINDRTGINSSGDSTQVTEHKYKNGDNSNVIEHQNESKMSSDSILDSVSNNNQIVSTVKEIDRSTKENKSKNGVTPHSSFKEFHKCSLREETSAGEGVGKEVPLASSLGDEMKDHVRHSSTKVKENPREENSSAKNKGRSTKSPSVSSLDKCTDVEQQSGISKENLSSTPVSSVDVCSGGQEDSSVVRTPSSNRANQGIVFRTSPALRTPPLKATVPLKASPSFEDPAVIKDHKFSYVVFNEQCNFQRPKRKRSIRISGGSIGSKSSPNTLRSDVLDKGIDQGILTTVNRSSMSESCQEKLFGNWQEVPCSVFPKQREESTKQTLTSNKTKHSNQKSDTVSDTLASSLSTRNKADNITKKLEINKKTDIVYVEGLQNNPKNLIMIKNADETRVKKKNVLYPKVQSKANICSTKGHEKKMCAPSTLFDDNRRASGGKLLGEGRKNPHPRMKAVPGEVLEKGNKVDSICNDLKANLEKKVSEKLSLEKDAVPESNRNDGLVFKAVRKPSSDNSDAVTANETPKLESGSNKSKPKGQRSIKVSTSQRKAANFQDSRTAVLPQVKSTTSVKS